MPIKPGHTVLDLACGTGENFPFLLEAVGESGSVIGVDLSAGMLAKARRRFGDRVQLIERDARQVGTQDVPQGVDHVTCVLGLSVIPEWQSVFQATWDLLAPGGSYGILDVHASSWVPQTSMVQLIAGAELSRKVWEPLEAAASEFTHEELPGSAHIHGGQLHLAVGTKAITAP